MGNDVREMVHIAVQAMEVVAVLMIVIGLAIGLTRFIAGVIGRDGRPDAYHRFKVWMGRTLLLGLEILVAADVVNTVALEPTMKNVATLGMLVLIRTFLAWSLELEIEGRWPWQARREPDPLNHT